mmetsp:Transcript_30141/g.34712  ORF Transcript_30141/g.34712 Transcript_30141/m.34712 type:complete len:180 (+) Transcript_30141:88-627(+)
MKYCNLNNAATWWIISCYFVQSSNAFSSSSSSLGMKKHHGKKAETMTLLKNQSKNDDVTDMSNSRRSFIDKTAAAIATTLVGINSVPLEANAKADCMSDCLKECKLIAPKDPGYCLGNCKDYCSQEDRNDGLSGSVSSTGGEMGILGTSTVVKGEDKPPSISLPGLDFTSEKGKKLLGY